MENRIFKTEIDKTYKTDKYTLYIESMVVDEDQIVLYYQVNIYQIYLLNLYLSLQHSRRNYKN